MNQKISPLVTYCIPVYNHEKYVENTIDSIILQDYENIELIIINDGSTDNSHSVIIKKIEKCRERFKKFTYINRENKGLSYSLNEALNIAEGTYISLIASDDIILSNKTSIQTEFLEKNQNFYACAGTQITIDSDGNVLPVKYQKYIISKHLEIDKRILFRMTNMIYSPTCMYRLNILKNLGGYDESIAIEDLYLFYLAASKGHNIALLPIIFTLYRHHTNNNHKNYIMMHENKLKILDIFKYDNSYSSLKRLVLLEGFYSLAKKNKLKAIKTLPYVIKYIDSIYLYGGIFNLLFKW
ncbi:glycosyltransferase [Xenorhabdus bovienii]|uniref:glycosyltransferase family 2 protein n=1 Tax=Xenorhabdus bovienii TaxID=40576 RepID=UPI0023B215C1|nr:glycosyltransferase [Xenorhabdus bovienii]MDE9444685.1 glycosyltransferase [Xenorhabdus bovienii]